MPADEKQNENNAIQVYENCIIDEEKPENNCKNAIDCILYITDQFMNYDKTYEDLENEFDELLQIRTTIPDVSKCSNEKNIIDFIEKTEDDKERAIILILEMARSDTFSEQRTIYKELSWDDCKSKFGISTCKLCNEHNEWNMAACYKLSNGFVWNGMTLEQFKTRKSSCDKERWTERNVDNKIYNIASCFNKSNKIMKYPNGDVRFKWINKLVSEYYFSDGLLTKVNNYNNEDDDNIIGFYNN